MAQGVAVKVIPNARREEVVGVRAGVLVLRVSAPAERGRANEAVRRLLAARLGVRAGAVQIVRGAGAREKVVSVEGMSPERVIAALQDER
jgi:uncharacterized protein YggU (UPF0235/DUF167 family)